MGFILGLIIGLLLGFVGKPILDKLLKKGESEVDKL